MEPGRPAEPAPSRYAFGPASAADAQGIVGVGADLEPGTLLAAYRAAIFPMPLTRWGPMGWWSPDPRGVLPPADVHVSRSLRRTMRRFEIRVDTAFGEVVRACADPSRQYGWITPRMRRSYDRLHELGWAHSVEAFDRGGELAGGLYGVRVGGLFAGESMFHASRDASKVALMALVELMRTSGMSLLDLQWCTDHLASLGAVAIPRNEYFARLAAALALQAVRMV